jgi:hypothetical protein
MEHPMSDRHYKTASGKITHVFGHRFVLKTEHGDVLADLTPKGLERFVLRLNDEVTLEGEMKPSELKVARLTRGGDTILIEHRVKPHDDHNLHADPFVALASAGAAVLAVLGSPRRKPKHFEVLGQRKGEVNELHIELGGNIRKTTSVAKDDPKWSCELRGAA